jgi:BirA family biotin operon repressor/biotin-[acetyl-CoA-carboxylase] ligase
MAVFAHDQVAGKGQRGRQWLSEKGQNIALSLLLQPVEIHPSRPFELSAAITLAVYRTIQAFVPEYLQIKWPNDLYWQDRKAGGILIENLISSQEVRWNWAIAGIGININQTAFSPDLPNPVSVRQITGRELDPLAIAKEICRQTDLYYRELLANGPENILNEYNSCLYKRNKVVKLKKENRVFEALIKSVNPSGQLLIEHSITEAIDFGSIEWASIMEG